MDMSSFKRQFGVRENTISPETEAKIDSAILEMLKGGKKKFTSVCSFVSSEVEVTEGIVKERIWHIMGQGKASLSSDRIYLLPGEAA
jgi:hypothetical protein